MSRYSVFWPRGEVILGDDTVRAADVVTTDAELSHIKVGEGQRSDERHSDVTVEPRGGVIRPVLLTLHDTVFHKVRQKHDLPTHSHRNKITEITWGKIGIHCKDSTHFSVL